MTEEGVGKIELRSVELDSYRSRALNRAYEDRGAIVCLRFLMGDGRIDYRSKKEGGLGSDNEVVNSGERQFVWKTVQDLATETSGKPNCNM